MKKIHYILIVAAAISGIVITSIVLSPKSDSNPLGRETSPSSPTTLQVNDTAPYYAWAMMESRGFLPSYSQGNYITVRYSSTAGYFFRKVTNMTAFQKSFGGAVPVLPTQILWGYTGASHVSYGMAFFDGVSWWANALLSPGVVSPQKLMSNITSQYL